MTVCNRYTSPEVNSVSPAIARAYRSLSPGSANKARELFPRVTAPWFINERWFFSACRTCSAR